MTSPQVPQKYDVLAKQWQAPRVDLMSDPPDPELLTRMSHHVALRVGWTPWRREGDTIIVATTVPPDKSVGEVARELYGTEHVEFRTTTPRDLWRSVQQGYRELLLYEAQDRLATLRPYASARAGLTRWQKRVPLTILLLTATTAALNPWTAVVVILAAANLLFASSILFKTVAALLVPVRNWRLTRNRQAEMKERARRSLSPVWHLHIDDADLPVYTVLIPVYKEANVIARILANVETLDYPRSKLDVMLLLEADDVETIAAATALNPPDHVRLIVVPPGKPQTKPRACNYGLSFARGSYVVIYDAEDRPDPQQLRVAAAAFARDSLERMHGLSRKPPLAVVQASLSFYNADYNVLTRMFAIEYAHWFEAMLPGMEEAGLPLPLGGTSNHFDTETLRLMGGWDPYNVTEDADAGLRVSVLGYRVAVIASTTWEEACSELPAWIHQRTRWVKGYIITAGVNTRHPIRFVRCTGPRGVVSIIGLIAATPIAFLSYPLALGFTVATYVGVQFIGLVLPSWVVVTSVITFLFGNALMIISSGIAATSRYNWRIGVFAIFGPVYWLLHGIAAWRAVFQVVRDPHRWEKTPHGLSEDYESDSARV
ncbi:MAG: glycosyltransferase [Nocardioides sp.]|nr:glycosyltransferase [Nocardioides sp.]